MYRILSLATCIFFFVLQGHSAIHAIEKDHAPACQICEWSQVPFVPPAQAAPIVQVESRQVVEFLIPCELQFGSQSFVAYPSPRAPPQFS